MRMKLFSGINLFGLGLKSVSSASNHSVDLDRSGSMLQRVPAPFSNLSAVFLKDNVAVIPGAWESGGTSKCASLK